MLQQPNIYSYILVRLVCKQQGVTCCAQETLEKELYFSALPDPVSHPPEVQRLSEAHNLKIQGLKIGCWRSLPTEKYIEIVPLFNNSNPRCLIKQTCYTAKRIRNHIFP